MVEAWSLGHQLVHFHDVRARHFGKDITLTAAGIIDEATHSTMTFNAKVVLCQRTHVENAVQFIFAFASA